MAQRKEERFCLVCQDPHAFSVGLFALLQAQKTVILPANAQEGTLLELQSQVEALLSDQDYPTFPHAKIHPLKTIPTKTFRFGELDRERISLELFTSGSTGVRKCIPKTLANLEDEIKILEGTFSHLLGQCPIFSTVSHQHIYGLLFGILWPLSSNRPFYEKTIFYPAEILPLLKDCDGMVLVSSPAHLKKMPALVDLKKLQGQCRAIFSSGGPLSIDDSRKFFPPLGFSPIEVLGSTETGGIGWRNQKEEGPPALWKTLEGVSLRISKEEETLLVKSPFVSRSEIGKDGWFEMGDSAEINADNTFQLFGRKDRIVKVSEKRLSLTEIEGRLCKHAFIEDAAVVTLNPSNEEIPEDRIKSGALLVLTPEGQAYLKDHGRKEIGSIFYSYLKEFYDAVVLPKKWRYVDQIPEDSQGKRPLRTLQKFFDDENKKEILFPKILKKSTSDNTLHLDLQVPKELKYFEGHFPEIPVVPGFVQMDWVMNFAHEYLGVPKEISKMEAIKFHELIPPDKKFSMEIKWDPKKGKLYYKLYQKEQIFAQGRFQIGKLQTFPKD